MELNEALSIVQQVKNRYQAFERLEQAAAAILGAQSSIKGMERALLDLTSKVDNKTNELAVLRATIESEQAAHAQKSDQATQDHRGRLAKMEEEASHAEQVIKEHFEAVKNRMEAELADLNEQRKHLLEEIASLGKDHNELRNVVETLKRRFA